MSRLHRLTRLKDYYRVLGVSEDADAETVKRAYRRLARRWHPDVNRSADAKERMSELNEAYRVISDAELRAEYDARRRRGVPEAPPPPTEAGAVGVGHVFSVVDFPSPLYSLAFAPDSLELAVGGFDNTIRFTHALTGEKLGEVSLPRASPSALRWVSRSRLVAVGSSERFACYWVIEDMRRVKTKTKRAEWVSAHAISPDGRKVALGSLHRSVVLWEPEKDRDLYVRRPHTSSVTALAFSPDGRLIASGGNDDRVVLLEARSGFPYCELGPFGVPPSALEFSADNSLLAICVADRSVRVHELRTGNLKSLLWLYDLTIETVAFHPCGWLVATGCRSGEVQLWNALGGKEVARLGGHGEAIRALAFSRDGRYLAVGGLDRVLSLWRVEVGEKPAP